MRKIEINDVTFELTIPRHHVDPNYSRFGCECDIYDFYDRPSRFKVAIWEDWLNWARDTDNVVTFYISGANGFQFTISGCVQTPDGKMYNLYITRDHNRAYLVH